MNHKPLLRFACGTLAATLLPAVALAEVSVLLGPDGSLRRVVYLTRGGQRQVVWGQVLPFRPLEVMLNPLGDNLGDLPPVIALHPADRRPWVFWSRNAAGLKQLVFSAWTDAGWSPARRLGGDVAPVAYDELDPAVAFDSGGAAYVVWWTSAPRGEVHLSGLVRGAFSPPLRLSDEGVDSRRPAIRIDGTQAVITWTTPDGPVTRIFDTAFLAASAAGLMDNPTPPGHCPDPGNCSGEPPSGGDGGLGDGPFMKK
ncbi:MAG: hypothetical protein ACRD5D_00995 [Candidatus Polarisedimenticolia bacterium]